MKRSITWLVVVTVLVALLAIVVYAGSAPRSAAPATPTAGLLGITSDVRTPGLQSEAPVPPQSIGVPSGVATAMPSEPATLTAKTPPKVTPAPTPTGHLLPPVVVAKGWATYQPGSGLWGSPSALVRSWGLGTVTVCGPLACRRIQLRNGCACGMRRGLPTLIDLAEPAWVVLCGSPSAGICRVEVGRP